MQNSRFEAIGAYLPTTSVSTRELVDSMAYRPPFDIETLTGIKARRVHDKRPESFEDSFALALAASRDCLARSRFAPGDLDVIISVSITRYKDGYTFYFEPSFALLLARALGAHSAIHFDLSNACAGMMTGVHVLDRLIRSGAVRNGLVVSGECITPISDTAVKEVSEPLDPQFGSLTVGDAGVAVVMDRATDDADKIHYVELVTNAEYSNLCIGMPSDKHDASALYTNNQQMHKAERLQLWPRWHRDYLAARGGDFASEGFDYVVHHQVGMRFIANMQRVGADVFGSEMPTPLACVDQYGNTASTAHFVVLYDHLRRKQVARGSKVLMVPAASGVVAGALSATISSLAVEA